MLISVRTYAMQLELSYITYLYLFFDGKKMPYMAELIKWGSSHVITYDLVSGFQKDIKKRFIQGACWMRLSSRTSIPAIIFFYEGNKTLADALPDCDGIG